VEYQFLGSPFQNLFLLIQLALNSEGRQIQNSNRELSNAGWEIRARGSPAHLSFLSWFMGWLSWSALDTRRVLA
jgi:hypothetical protein